MMHLRLLIVLALCVLLMRPDQSQADMTSMMPLAVGNSWEYKLNVDMWGHPPEYSIPISITHTEKTYSSDPYHYYVFSDLPVYDPPMEYSPPLPFFFLEGKKVRWSEDGQDLFFYREWPGDVAVFRFDGNYKVRELYDFFPDTIGHIFNPDIPVYTTGGTLGIRLPPLGYPDHDVDVRFDLLGEEDLPVVQFRFPDRVVFQGGFGSYERDLTFTFAKGLGLVAASGFGGGIGCGRYMGHYDPTAECFSDVGGISIDLRLESAVIDGVQWRWEEGDPLPTPSKATAVQEHSWGAVKHLFHK